MTTVDGLMDHLLPLSMIKESCLNIMVGQTLDMEEIKHLLTGMGYERMGQVDGMGQFSVRGVEYTVNLRGINENHLNNNLVG